MGTEIESWKIGIKTDPRDNFAYYVPMHCEQRVYEDVHLIDRDPDEFTGEWGGQPEDDNTASIEVKEIVVAKTREAINITEEVISKAREAINVTEEVVPKAREAINITENIVIDEGIGGGD